MKSDGKFYTFPTTVGQKTINIENIAAIEDLGSQTSITLNVTKGDGKNLNFITILPWATVSAEVTFMSEQILKR